MSADQNIHVQANTELQRTNKEQRRRRGGRGGGEEEKTLNRSGLEPGPEPTENRTNTYLSNILWRFKEPTIKKLAHRNRKWGEGNHHNKGFKSHTLPVFPAAEIISVISISISINVIAPWWFGDELQEVRPRI